MKQSLTLKQENFLQAYIATGNASEAYQRAYNTAKMKSETVNRKAVEVLQNDKVAARIAKLQQEARERHVITTDRLTREALEVYAEARKDGRYSAATRCLEFLAKMHGLEKGIPDGQAGGAYIHIEID